MKTYGEIKITEIDLLSEFGLWQELDMEFVVYKFVSTFDINGEYVDYSFKPYVEIDSIGYPYIRYASPMTFIWEV